MIARLGMELGLVGSFLRSGGGPRAALVASCTALVSGLMLVALTVVLFTSTPPVTRSRSATWSPTAASAAATCSPSC